MAGYSGRSLVEKLGIKPATRVVALGAPAGYGQETDLTENIVREIGLKEGLVDVKVCAVDEVWSGLKFVRRVINRAR